MYRIHLPTLTVIRHADGQDFDLNAQGEPCRTVGDLRVFVEELHAQGAYNAATRDRLLADVRREHRGGSRKGHPNVGGTRRNAGRPRLPRLTADEATALLRELVPDARTPAEYARALGCRPERVREALRGGCTVATAERWREAATEPPGGVYPVSNQAAVSVERRPSGVWAVALTEPDDVRAALASLRSTVATDPRDWSLDRRDAWIYGVVCGWDEALSEVAARHGWSAADAARLSALHAIVTRAAS